MYQYSGQQNTGYASSGITRINLMKGISGKYIFTQADLYFFLFFEIYLIGGYFTICTISAIH